MLEEEQVHMGFLEAKHVKRELEGICLARPTLFGIPLPAVICEAARESTKSVAVSSANNEGTIRAARWALVKSGNRDVAGTQRQNETTLKKLRIQKLVRSSQELKVMLTKAIPNCAALNLYRMLLL